MALDDWKKISDELAGIKQQAYHEGYNKAVEDFGEAKKKADREQESLRNKTMTWNRAIHNIREAFARFTEQEAQWMDPSKDKYRYQLLFGNKQLIEDSVYLNMPEDEEQFVFALDAAAKMAADFQLLLDEFKKNPIVKAQWDRLLVAMRMTE